MSLNRQPQSTEGHMYTCCTQQQTKLVNADKNYSKRDKSATVNLFSADSDDAVHVRRHVPRQHDGNVSVSHFG